MISNPTSQNKKLLSTALSKLSRTSSKSQITLNRDEKNAMLEQQRNILEKFNLFLFDWNRFSKDLSERDFNRVALLLGDFIEHLKQFREVVSKSETVKESVDKLLEKFSVVNIKFEQAITYSNTGR